MTTLINSDKYAVDKERRHPLVVPAAAVWDPRAARSEPGLRSTHGAGVRTLCIEYPCPESVGHDVTMGGMTTTRFVAHISPVQFGSPSHNLPSCVASANPRPVGAGRQSSLGTWIVGAVFGLILVGGTIGGASLAGDNTPIDGYSAGVEAVVSPPSLQ